VAQRAVLRYNGRRIWTERGRRKAIRGLTLAMENILEKSNRVVPLDEATLQRSGRISIDEDNLRGAVSYGTPYAVRQHEELTWKHAPGRKAKYLESAVNESREETAQIIANEMKSWFSGG
jgi:hypothetical protein